MREPNLQESYLANRKTKTKNFLPLNQILFLNLFCFSLQSVGEKIFRSLYEIKFVVLVVVAGV